MELINESLPKELASAYIQTKIDINDISYFVKFSKLFDFENSEYTSLSKQEAKDLYKEHPEELQIILKDNTLIVLDKNGSLEATNTLLHSSEYTSPSVIDLIDKSIARYKVEFKSKDSSKSDANFKNTVNNISKFIDDINAYLKDSGYDYNDTLDIHENVLTTFLKDKISQVFAENRMIIYRVRFENDIIDSDVFDSLNFIWSANIPSPLAYYKNLIDDKQHTDNLHISHELYLAICFTYNYNMLKRIGALNSNYPSRVLDKLHDVCLDFFNQFNILLKMIKVRTLITVTFNAISESFKNSYSKYLYYLKSAHKLDQVYDWLLTNVNNDKQSIETWENTAIIDVCDDSLTKLENDINSIEQKLAIFINDEAFKESKIKLIKDLNRIDLEIAELKSKLKK
jgi:hypothetical protein